MGKQNFILEIESLFDKAFSENSIKPDIKDYIKNKWRNYWGKSFDELLYEAKDFYKRLQNCDICPNNCNVNRFEGEIGVCGQTYQLKVSSYNLHFGEEPFISGKNGSGTVFFTGCSLKCLFCQNYPISQLNNGRVYSIEKLKDIFIKLQSDFAHNINLVTPTHFAPHIYLAYLLSKIYGFNIPLAYNNSGYEKIEVLGLIKNFADIFIYDVKYGDDEIAYKYSKIKDYVKYNFEGLKYLVSTYGDENIYGFDEIIRSDCSLDCKSCYNPVHEIEEELKEEREVNDNDKDKENGNSISKIKKIKVIKRGIILRHLIIPGHIENSFKVIDKVSDISKNITIGLMNQYFPAYKAFDYRSEDLDRRLTQKEYDKVINYAIKKGLKNILLQI